LDAETRPGPVRAAPLTRMPQTRSTRKPRSLTHRPTTGMLLVAPAVALVSFFALIPIAFAGYISFTSWPLIGDYRFIGLENYRQAIADPAMWKALRYTLLYTGIVTGRSCCSATPWRCWCAPIAVARPFCARSS